jgi:hypothetical protein
VRCQRGCACAGRVHARMTGRARGRNGQDTAGDKDAIAVTVEVIGPRARGAARRGAG